MITIVCTSCKTALYVIGEVSEVDHLLGTRSEYWPDKFPCFNCNAKASGLLTAEVSPAAMHELNVYELNVQEAFAAINGLGIPAERNCCAEVVVPLLESVGLKVNGKEFRGAMRYFIDALELPDGTKLHLAASPQGACVYRVTKPHSYRKANDVG